MRNKKYSHNTALFAALAFFLFLICGCDLKSKGANLNESGAFLSYRDIPGVTSEEIAAIEELKKEYSHFIYGMPLSVDAFENENGTISGFSALTCEWLSELFGIPFKPAIYKWKDLFSGLESGEISFSGELACTEERLENFIMTSAIISRPLKNYRIEDAKPLEEIIKERPPLYGFIEGSASIKAVTSELTDGTYEIVLLEDFSLIYQALKSGKIDVFFYSRAADVNFINYGDVIALEYFPFIRMPIAISTQTEKFTPIISVIDKALYNNASRYLVELYNQSYLEYQKYKLFAKLTSEEIEYIKNDPVIRFSADFDNYPSSFYDTRSGEWLGIGFDVLNEIKKITGLKFTMINNQHDGFMKLFNMLENGDSKMHLELVRSRAREGRFLWPASGYKTDYPALISKMEYRIINIHEIYSMKVGLTRGTAYAEMFHRWFPNHTQVTEYEHQSESFDALFRGDVDMVMNSYSGLLYLTHYREYPNFKINILFENSFDSTFGFNKNEVILCSIIDKALSIIDTLTISEQWMRRTYDYRIKLVESQRPLLLGFSVMLLLVLALLFVLLQRNRRSGKMLENLVTERTREIELQTVTLTALFDSIPDFVFTKDLNLKYMHCNKSLLEYFGVSMEAVIGKNDVEGLSAPPEIAEKHNAMDRAVINEGKAVVCEEYIKDYKGNKLLYETIKIPLKLNDVMIGFLGISRDITKRKEMEETALAASRSKSEFLAVMSHEIRTPMNSIIGFSELALDDNIPARTREYLCKILENTEGLLLIINDILDISKIESGKIELEKIPFNMHELLETCQEIIMPKADEKGILMHFYAEPNLGKMPVGDPTKLRQVILNLLSNAVKFTNAGMVKFFIEIINTTDDSITMHFEIKDSGIGMSAEQINRIFEPFIQAETGTTRKFGGTGLGLPITKNIIELMGGEIFVESTLGAGSRFYFDLTFDTIDMSQDDIALQNLRIKELDKPQFEGEILICEDNNMNQQVISEHLARVGLKSVVAGNGKIGVDFVKNRLDKGEKQFDMIFMDMHMPVMDGIEAANNILKLCENIPIVAMTANIMSSDREKYRKNGIKDCVGKPFTSQELWHCLLKHLMPLKNVSVNNEAASENDLEFQQTLRLSFVNGNKDKYIDIRGALESDNIKLAHRLAHSLKSNAGQIGEPALQKTAAEIENLLISGTNNVKDEQLKNLKKELAEVITKITAELQHINVNDNVSESGNDEEFQDEESVKKLFEELEPLLEMGSPNSCQLTNKLRGIPGSEKLIQQIEDFDFEPAAETLRALKKTLGI